MLLMKNYSLLFQSVLENYFVLLSTIQFWTYVFLFFAFHHHFTWLERGLDCCQGQSPCWWREITSRIWRSTGFLLVWLLVLERRWRNDTRGERMWVRGDFGVVTAGLVSIAPVLCFAIRHQDTFTPAARLHPGLGLFPALLRGVAPFPQTRKHFAAGKMHFSLTFYYCTF